jgi:hypothetical protein
VKINLNSDPCVQLYHKRILNIKINSDSILQLEYEFESLTFGFSDYYY